MSTAKELKKEIERGVWDASLGKLYGRRAGVLERQRARYADALDCFAALYGGEREAAIYSAPGRTEIGGNHTDHNHGVVMARRGGSGRDCRGFQKHGRCGTCEIERL